MARKAQLGPRRIRRYMKFVAGGVLLVSLGLYVNALLASGTPETPNKQEQQAPRSLQSLSSASESALTETYPTTDWKVALSNRSGISFSFRYPPSWSSPYEQCNTPPDPKALELSANCIKITIITDRMPPEDTEEDLISDTPIRVSGYEARRKVYAAPGDRSKTPYDYELWLYEEGLPIFYWVGYIGGGTDPKTALGFVRVFDTMVGSLEIQRR